MSQVIRLMEIVLLYHEVKTLPHRHGCCDPHQCFQNDRTIVCDLLLSWSEIDHKNELLNKAQGVKKMNREPPNVNGKETTTRFFEI